MTPTGVPSKVAALVAAALTFSPIASADLVPFHDAVAEVCIASSISSAGCNVALALNETHDGTASVSGVFGSAAVGVEANVGATATSKYGELKAGSSNSLNISGSPKFVGAIAAASFLDIITIDAAWLHGRTGAVLLSYTLDGSISQSGVDHAFALVLVHVGTSLEQHYSALYATSVAGSWATNPFSFTFGTPFGMEFMLWVATGTITPYGNEGFQTTMASGSGAAAASFEDTLVLSGLTVVDDAGNLVDNPTFTSVSGTPYSTHGVVPEPSSLLLLLPVCLAVVPIRKRGKPELLRVARK